MDEPRTEHDLSEQDRREFLKACGRFAAVTSPTVTMLLSTSLTSDAIASSIRGGGTQALAKSGIRASHTNRAATGSPLQP
ncbi:hypothetical protein GOD34_13320 [Sinorhizobium medicae]|nr:hypothetical protein [Sinorhizobium medicae]